MSSGKGPSDLSNPDVSSLGPPEQWTRHLGSHDVTLTRLRQSDFEFLQPSLPQFTLSILLAGRSRPWRDLGDGFEIPKGAEAGRHQGTGIVTPHDTVVGWRVEGQHDCLVFSFPVEKVRPLLEELLPRGTADLYRLASGVIRDEILPSMALGLWESGEDRIGRFQSEHAVALVLARLAGKAENLVADDHASARARERLSPSNLRKADAFLRSKAAEDPSLEEIAAVTGLSPYHFLRAFKTETGRTPFQYLQDLRIEMACGLLAATDLPIAHVALDVGFKSQSHFSTVFRRTTGTTPARWRAELRA